MMDLNRWQEGLNLCMENVIHLRDDGELLMENKSFGHAYFSFYTALEELGVAFYILSNYNYPKPEELNKLLHSKDSHKKKAYLQIFDMFKTHIKELNLPSDYFKTLYETGESYESFMAKKLDKHLEIWQKRNRGIYFSPDKNAIEWLIPQSITAEDIIPFRDALNIEIENMKTGIGILERLKTRFKR